MKKVGLFGGTFNPPHIGHLLFALRAKEVEHLDEVWFVPTNISPHKEVGTSSIHRMAMVERAISPYESFQLNDIELTRKGKSYTYDTVKLLKDRHPDIEFSFLIGADMVESIDKWYKYEELLDEVDFVGVARTGYEAENQFGIRIIEVPLIDISSTEIRERCQKGLPIVYFVPKCVELYIKENELYGCSNN